MISLYENGLNGILADEMGLGKVRFYVSRMHTNGVDPTDHLVPRSSPRQGDMGTVLDCLSAISAEQLDYRV